MGGAEQVGRATWAASAQEMGGGSAGMPPVVIAVGQESQGVGWVYRRFTPWGRQVFAGSRVSVRPPPDLPSRRRSLAKGTRRPVAQAPPPILGRLVEAL